jgi:polyhydroxybutyrate depolymerase
MGRSLPFGAIAAALLALASTAACSHSRRVLGRRYYSRAPARYDRARPAPLLVLLHPYYRGDGQQAVETYELEPILDDNGLLLAAPDGTLETGVRRPRRFWNATDACCDFGRRGIDDVAFIDAVIADMRARYRVDDKRIFVIGYSNGGYLAHRLLCDRAPTIAAAASIAGAAWKDPSRCRPAAAAALLEVHGDADERVPYAGATFENGTAIPSAQEGVADWAQKIGCRGPAQAAPARDLMPDLPGAETAVARFDCPVGAAELWTVGGGGHRGLSPTMRAAIDFLLAHPKP